MNVYGMHKISVFEEYRHAVIPVEVTCTSTTRLSQIWIQATFSESALDHQVSIADDQGYRYLRCWD